MIRQHRGFTLLEVLVALAILATALYATSGSVRSAARQQAHREASLLAHWAAMNVATELSLRKPGDAPPESRRLALYNQQFIAAIAPLRDAEDRITAFTISVALASAPDDRLHSLTMALP